MDSSVSLSPEMTQGLQNLPERDRQELSHFINQEGTYMSTHPSYARPGINNIYSAKGPDPSDGALAHRYVLQEVCPVLSKQWLYSLTPSRCVTSRISGGKLDRSEEPCMQNCVDRYMDANMLVIRHLEQMRTMQ